jgi:hypothetical protein
LDATEEVGALYALATTACTSAKGLLARPRRSSLGLELAGTLVGVAAGGEEEAKGLLLEAAAAGACDVCSSFRRCSCKGADQRNQTLFLKSIHCPKDYRSHLLQILDCLLPAVT